MRLFDKRFNLLFVLAMPLLLGACGEGWQVVYTKQVNPYGNDRTAGSGVIYVREILMPAKTLSLKPLTVSEPDIKPAAAKAPVEDQFVPAGTVVPKVPSSSLVEKVFTQAQSK